VVLLAQLVMLYFLELQNVEEHAHLDNIREHQTIVARLVLLPVLIARELELMIV
jgi:hypothetical protein